MNRPKNQGKSRKFFSTPSSQTTQNGEYWLYGIHAAQSSLTNPNRRCHQILATRALIEKNSDFSRKISEYSILSIVDNQTLEKNLPREAVHQGIAVRVSPLSQPSLHDLEPVFEAAKHPVVIALDQVTDPHNIGAILRTAAAFGALAVISPRDHAPQENATMAKAACGAMDIVPYLLVTNLRQALDDLKAMGFWCLGLDGEAKKTLAETTLPERLALVMGAEGKGLRRLTKDNCDLLAKIAISPQMESLNVSNATSVALYELTRNSQSL